MATFNHDPITQGCAIATVVDITNKLVRISFLDRDDKAFGYIEYGFDEMPIINQTGNLCPPDIPS